MRHNRDMKYGEYHPNLDIEDVISGSDGMQQVRAAGDSCYWLANISAENNRGTIKRWHNGEVFDLTPDRNIRTRVNEYGGGTYDVDDHNLVYVDDVTKQVFCQAHNSTAKPISPSSDLVRFAGLRLATELGLVFAVRETHHADRESDTELVALKLTSDNDNFGEVIATGADFYGRPAYSKNRIAWAQWNHPNMPWDSCEIWATEITAEPKYIAGGPEISSVNPFFLADGTLGWFDDGEGYWNICLENGLRFSEKYDACLPPWIFSEPPVAQIDDHTLIGLHYVSGLGSLASFDLTTGEITDLDLGMAEVESVASSPAGVFVISHWADKPTSLAKFNGGKLMPLITENGFECTSPESIWFDGIAGKTHALLYPVPDNGDGPPPVIVRCHGGPTGMARPGYDLETQFWCSRGIQILDINYSGSAGFGRQYRERLKGNWGVLDVADCISAVEELIATNRIAKDKVAIMGGSAGGYTVLQSLVTSDVFSAGISKYGIGDLVAMTKDTHKFESRYLDGLVGQYPQQVEIYQQRSPINHIDKLATPMLILQGNEDLVVPLNQAEDMAAAVREKGLPVALLVFEGEGHGFRNVSTRKTALAAQLSFLAQVWGFEPAGEIAKLAIENLN